MCTATLDLISPSGVPVTLRVNHADDQQTILDTADRAEKIGLFFAARGWALVQAEAQGPGTPHYDEIEVPAHEVGQQLSRLIQSTRASDVAAEQEAEVACPDCGNPCCVQSNHREIHSMDGPLGLTETVAKCQRCRRSFFPSA